MTMDPPGSRVSLPPAISAEAFDLEYEVTSRSDLVWRLAAEAFGDEYPAEVQPWGMTTWWVLGRLVAGCRVGPGQRVVDLGCGRGGPGLWLARATGADLVGVDWSPVAVREATMRADDFVPDGRARFVIGDLGATGLPEEYTDAVICIDALPYAADRLAALREVHRILRIGGRFVLTVTETPDPQYSTQVQDWSPLVHASGLVVESKERIPGFDEQLAAMSRVWAANARALRLEFGEQMAENLLRRAAGAGLALPCQEQKLVTIRRPL